MKKRVHLLIAFMLIFVLTGCARINIDVNIKEDGKVDTSVLYAFIEAAASGTDMLTDADIKDLTDEGWEYSAYNEDGYIGYTLNIKDEDIRDLVGQDNDSDKGFDVDETFSVKIEDGKYIFDCDLLEESDAEMLYESKEYFAMYGGYMTVTLHVPQPALYSNATYVTDEGKTLTWDLLEMMPGESIHAEFKMSRARPAKMIGVAIASVAAVMVIILVVLLVGRKAKKKKAEAAAASGAGQGGYFEQGSQSKQPYPNNAQPYQNQEAGAPVYTYGSQLTAPTQGSAPVPQMPTQGSASVSKMPTQGPAPVPQMPTQGSAPVPQMPAQGSAPVPQMPTQEPSSVASEQNMQPCFCPQCGAKISVPSSYCQICGTKLS